jgi:GTP-binding protein Era
MVKSSSSKSKKVKSKSYCGYVAIIGRPNVGKSTLLNQLIGQKISITSHKPQTTRHQILGVSTNENKQILYLDTPGLHRATKRAINHYMNRVAQQALESVEIIGFVVEALKWTEEDEWILAKLKNLSLPVPIVLIINKSDTVKPRQRLLPYMEKIAAQMQFADVVPVSAKSGENVAELETVFTQYLPEGPHLFPDDSLTDRSNSFLASEVVREKLTRFLHQELPYGLTVTIEEFKMEEKVLHIHAIIWLERDSQKPIVVGKDGAQLKIIGTKARIALEKLFEQKVFLRLWAKVKTNWSDDLQALKSLGYDGE